jgi:uncharacterized protein YihD (DUF1040 family)
VPSLAAFFTPIVVSPPPPSLYADDEIELKPWYHSYAWKGKKDFIGVSVGADALYEPLVSVVKDGWVLQVSSPFCESRVNIDINYKPLIDSAKKRAREETIDEKAEEYFEELMELNARKTAEEAAIQDIKNSVGENYKTGVLRIALPCQVLKQIHKKEIRGEYDNGGRVLYVDLVVKKEESFEEAQVAARAPLLWP